MAQSDRNTFWQLWGQQQDYLYKRCLSWMKGNPTEAEEVLSRASIKAWEKWQDYAEKVTNPKAWLTQLTYNLCMDMHRERSREVGGIESLENVAVAEDEYVASRIPSPNDCEIYRALCEILPAAGRLEEFRHSDIFRQGIQVGAKHSGDKLTSHPRFSYPNAVPNGPGFEKIASNSKNRLEMKKRSRL